MRTIPFLLATAALAGLSSAQIQISPETEPLATTGLGVLSGRWAPDDLYAVDAGGTLFYRPASAATFTSFPAVYSTEQHTFAVGDPLFFGQDGLLIGRDFPVPGPGWILSWAIQVSGTSFGNVAELTFFADETPRFIVPVDLDGDFDEDIVVAASNGAGVTRMISVLTDGGVVVFTFASAVLLTGEPTGLVTTDIDDDGDLDLALTLDTGSLLLFENNGTGSLVAPPPLVIPVGSAGTGEVPLGVVAGDMDGDLVDELVVANGGGIGNANAIQILSRASGSWVIQTTIAGGAVTPTGPVTLGALDTDPDIDIAIGASNGSRNFVSVFFNNQNDPAGPFSSTRRQEVDTLAAALCNLATTERSGRTSLIGMEDPGTVQHYVYTPPAFIRGDANEDGSVNIADSIFILNALFISGSPVSGNLDAMDVNDDGRINIADPITLNNWLFVAGSAPPAAPFPGPGVDPTEDDNGGSVNFDLNG